MRRVRTVPAQHYRKAAPAEMLARLRPLAAAAGITRLADLTGLDRIGLPVFQAVRPMARSLAVSMGKGAHPAIARISALVESIELHRAETIEGDGNFRPARAHEAALWARVPMAPGQPGLFDGDRPREWLAGHDLVGGGGMAVPLEMVSMDLARDVAPDIRQSSNGLASGADRDEAIVAALLELLEREGRARWLERPHAAKRATRIALGAIPDRRIRAALARIAHAGLRLMAWDIGEGIGVPAYYCALVEMDRAATLVLPPGVGSACHPDPAAALMAAIGEAAQARIMFIAGARDDLEDEDYRDPAGKRLGIAKETLAFEPDGAQPFPAGPPWVAGDAVELRDRLTERCRDAGADAIVCVDLGGGASGLATVKLLAPGFGDHERPSAFA
ncbi:hypothetical protein CV103_16280 [Sphingomonas fennica]|uniref:YcaO domain-containing protein n=1 Tax=Edaphosphingomonas fennica TaxID=114404 RepID=A0A2T4HQ26_9SPHN|nr:hypothetical protein CV103_16280 [Sphingomonas fennica]